MLLGAKRGLLSTVALIGLGVLLNHCGTDQTVGPLSTNPATRPTPGFGLITGEVDLNSDDSSAFSSLQLPASSGGSSIPALHVNLSADGDESADGDGDVLVVLTNSMGDSFSTVTNDDGSFAVKARKETASRVELFAGGEYLATMVFGLDTKNSRTTDTLLLDNATEEMDLGVVAQRDQWAVPEVNPLELTDDDNDGYNDLEDLDDDNDGILDVNETDEDGDGFVDFFSEYYDETGTLVRSFTMEGKTLNRDVDLSDLDEITIIDSTINGRVTISGSAYVFIDPTTISDLSIADCAKVVLEELTVDANLALDTIEDLTMTSSHVKGNTSMKNIKSGAVEDSEFEGEFTADESSAIAEKGNKKGKPKGETTDGATAEVEHSTSIEGSMTIEYKDEGGIILDKTGSTTTETTSTVENNGNGGGHTTDHSTTVTHSVYVDSGNGAVVDNTTTTTNSSTDTSTTDTSTTDTSPGNSGGGGPPATPPGGGKKK
ncbi:MAG: hypothetical protein HYU99_03505 [Deltaproteobacteria bacterium]|nr:hypothetical protein [Deltaproteobacteria bacterium]